MNARLRVFLTVVSVIFAALLAIQFVATLLRPADQASPSADRQRVVDRPAAAQPAPNPPRTPSGRSLMRHAESSAKAGYDRAKAPHGAALALVRGLCLLAPFISDRAS